VPIPQSMDRRTIEPPTTALVFSPSGKRLAVAYGGDIGMIDVESGKYLHSPRLGWGFITQLTFHPDGKSFVTANALGLVSTWDTESLTRKLTIATNQGRLTALAFHPTRDVIVSGGQNGSLKTWSAADGKPISELLLAIGINDIIYRPDGRC